MKLWHPPQSHIRWDPVSVTMFPRHGNLKIRLRSSWLEHSMKSLKHHIYNLSIIYIFILISYYFFNSLYSSNWSAWSACTIFLLIRGRDSYVIHYNNNRTIPSSLVTKRNTQAVNIIIVCFYILNTVQSIEQLLSFDTHTFTNFKEFLSTFFNSFIISSSNFGQIDFVLRKSSKLYICLKTC